MIEKIKSKWCCICRRKVDLRSKGSEEMSEEDATSDEMMI